MSDFSKYTGKVSTLPTMTPAQEARLGDVLSMKRGVPGVEGLRSMKQVLMNSGDGNFSEKDATATALAYKSWAGSSRSCWRPQRREPPF